MKTVRDLLSVKGSDVQTVAPEATVFEALELMAEKNVGALVVVSGDRVVGILSERDYARKVVLHGRVPRETPVEEIMTREVHFVTPDEPIEWCMADMTSSRIRHLPVLDGERLGGIISIGDVVRALLDEQRYKIEQLEQFIQR